MENKCTEKEFNFLFNARGSIKQENNLLKQYPELYYRIINYKVNLNRDIPFIQKIYNFIFSLSEIPKCPICNNDCKFNETLKKGYNKFCSIKCASNSNVVKNKIKQTNLKKYGVEHYNNIKKIKETNLKKYGVENPLSNKIVRNKIKETNLKKYGFENPFQNENIKEIIKEINLKKYGVKNPSQSEEIKKKKTTTTRKKYGKDYFVQTNESKKRKINHFLNKFKNINIELYSNSGDTKIYKIIDNCEIHKEFLINHYTLYNRYFIGNQQILCTFCNPPEKTHISNFQLEVEKFLLKNKINFENKNRTIIFPYEIDIYIPHKKIGIEINGDYYHSTKFKDKNYHINKTNLSENKNIKLIHLWSSDFYKNKNIIFSILKNKLDLNENIIYGRNCKIEKINHDLSKKFLEQNHLQGNVNASIRLGLFHSGELVSLMTFGKLRKNLNQRNEQNSYELYRFCNKLNTIVIGGASKLLKYFENLYNPKKIITFANRDISNGNLYEKLNFTFINNTNPSYWWERRNIKYNRYDFRKDVLIRKGYDSSKTETEIMEELGYNKIYNSGNKKYIKTYE